ncbi:MAG: hypothetical protein WC365_00815 [Candidatus Babeliales bacterium]|jgi:hypothetical protein
MISKAEAIKLLKQNDYYLSHDKTLMIYHVTQEGGRFSERLRPDTGRELSKRMNKTSNDLCMVVHYKGFTD